jgi:hypothetical protein
MKTFSHSPILSLDSGNCFCTSKETVTRVKRQNGRMGESFHSKTESLIQKIIQNIQRAQELNSKTTKNPIHKWANE